MHVTKMLSHFPGKSRELHIKEVTGRSTNFAKCSVAKNLFLFFKVSLNEALQCKSQKTKQQDKPERISCDAVL